MKNKKIIARILALCASLLFVVALAVPCFADGVVSEESYCVKTITFTDRGSAWSFLSQNYTNVIKVVGSMVGTGDIVFNQIRPLFGQEGQVSSIDIYSLAPSNVSEYTFSLSTITGNINETVLQLGMDNAYFEYDSMDGSVIYRGNDEQEIPDAYWSQLGIIMTVYYYEEFTPTVAPIDPDAPTRTGLYGNLYYIIRDAIFGENALLDASQEFTLTQIATVMTYAVLLLPFIVVAIIFFKLVRL